MRGQGLRRRGGGRIDLRALIDEVLAHTGKASQRERLLPAPAVVYYVMALALWREAPLEEVLRVADQPTTVSEAVWVSDPAVAVSWFSRFGQ